jgi:Cytochrome P460
MLLRTLITALVLMTALAPAADKPRFNAAGELLFPANYREWVFLSSGLGMTYGPNARRATDDPRFTNVFVDPVAYRKFTQTGHWPEGTMFVLEIRHSSSEGSINKGGHFQSKIAAIEVEVKDTRRFPSGWAYFDFEGGNGAPKAAVAALGPKATCPACHSTNGAVESTFVQFYPSLIDVARAKGTLKPQFAAGAQSHVH